jgi:hypothetical protein
MFERAEVSSRETQYGIRVDGVIQPIAVGPAEAERYRAGGADIHRRHRTRYYDDVSEWAPLPTPTTPPTEGADAGEVS